MSCVIEIRNMLLLWMGSIVLQLCCHCCRVLLDTLVDFTNFRITWHLGMSRKKFVKSGNYQVSGANWMYLFWRVFFFLKKHKYDIFKKFVKTTCVKSKSIRWLEQQKVDLVTRLDVIKSAIMSKTRHGSSKVAQF